MKYSKLILVLLPLFFASCKEPVTIDELKQIEVQKHIMLNTKKEYRKCKNKAMEKAIKIVDSILIAETKLFLDTLNKAPKPTKPELNYQPRHSYDVELKPIFEDTSKNTKKILQSQPIHESS